MAGCTSAASTPALPTLSVAPSLATLATLPPASPGPSSAVSVPPSSPAAPASLPMSSATSTASATPTRSPVPSPSPSPTVAPTQPSETIVAFTEDELAILNRVPAAVRAGCQAVDVIYTGEIDSIHCSAVGQPDVDYSKFPGLAEMGAAFDEDRDIAVTPPTAQGTCAQGNYESSYSVTDSVAGQIRCMTVTGSKTGTVYRVIEWTNEPLLILSYLSSATLSWDEIILFWQSQAGPTE